jgi:hyaluronan synthase
MTVVIPAYDEGAMVAKAIDSVASTRYPLERLEIVMADDGSTDDTWHQVQLAVARQGGRVRAVRQDRSRRRRNALAAGFRQARGDILVSVDSDSVVEPAALLAKAVRFNCAAAALRRRR